MSVRPRAPPLQVEWILGSPSFFEAFGSSPYIHLVHLLAFEDLLALRQNVVDLSSGGRADLYLCGAALAKRGSAELSDAALGVDLHVFSCTS